MEKMKKDSSKDDSNDQQEDNKDQSILENRMF